MQSKLSRKIEMRSLKNLIGGEDGAEIVEFAVSALILFTLILGILEFSMAIYAGSFTAYAAQQGARHAQVRGNSWQSACASISSYGCLTNQEDVQNYVLSLPHPGINLTADDIVFTPLTTTATGSTCTQYSQGCQIEVQINYSFPLRIPFLNKAIPLASTSIETIQD